MPITCTRESRSRMQLAALRSRMFLVCFLLEKVLPAFNLASNDAALSE